MQTALGCGRDEVDGKTFDEVNDLEAYWRDNPPGHEMLQLVASLLGWKPQRSEAVDQTAPMTEDEARAFEAMVNGG